MAGKEKMETVKAVIANSGRAIAGKAKELTEIAKLKAQIMSCEELIRKNYLEIGRKVYEAFEEAENEESDVAGLEKTDERAYVWEERYKKQCTAIENANRAIEDLKLKITELQKQEKE